MGFRVNISSNPYANSAVITVQPLESRITNITTSFFNSVTAELLSPLRALEKLFSPSYSSISESSLVHKNIESVVVEHYVFGSIFKSCLNGFLKDFCSFFQIPASKFDEEQNEISRTHSAPRSEPKTESASSSRPRAHSAPRAEPNAESSSSSRPRAHSAPRSESKTESAHGSRPRAHSAHRSEPNTGSVPSSMPKTHSAHQSEPNAGSAPSSRPRAHSAPHSAHNGRPAQGASKQAQQEPNPAVELKNRAFGLLGVKESNPSNYKLLGLPEGASKTDVKKAYVKLSLQFHPDKYKGDDKPAAEEAFKLFSAAYHALYDN